jgi:putative tricarboxylic transport membrane protein
MPTRRDLLRSAALVPAAVLPLSLATIDAARAQSIDLLKLFVPAAPGGGWDQTARTIEQVLRATGAVKGVQITNVGGAGGAVGLPQFLNQWKGQGNALMVAGMVMVGAIIANKSPVKLAQATPIARLTGEFLALVVPAQSPFKSAKDFAAALKADPTKVPVAGGSGRRVRPHPHRHDRQGARRRTHEGQLRGIRRWRAGDRRPARQPGGRRHLWLWRVRRAGESRKAAGDRHIG